MAKKKPKTDNPLTVHASGQWCKWVPKCAKFPSGGMHYFGVDLEAALKDYKANWEPYYSKGLSGPDDRTDGDEVAVGYLVNAFLDAKRKRVDSGELSLVSWHEYHRTGGIIADQLGRKRLVKDLRPSHFADLRASQAERLGAAALGKFVVLTRSIFGWGFTSNLLEIPAKFGPDFTKPNKRQVRLERAAKGPKLVDAADLQKMIETANPVMRAMLYLGINAGLGGTDLSELTKDTLTVKPGWLVALRRKTGTPRRCPLWPETITAIKAAQKVRPKAKNQADDECVFLTRTGQRFVRNTEANGKLETRNSIGEAYGKLAVACGVEHPGGFYALRHTFRTIADRSKDLVACRLIMGHQEQGIDQHYVETVDDERLEAVVAVVRQWLLGRSRRSTTSTRGDRGTTRDSSRRVGPGTGRLALTAVTSRGLASRGVSRRQSGA